MTPCVRAPADAARARFLAVARAVACIAAAALARAPAWSEPPPARRIVSLVPSITETLFAIGAGDDIVGVSDYCRFPEAALLKPRVGGLLNPNLERIVELRPSAVALSVSSQDLGRKLQNAGFNVTFVKTDSLEDVYASIHAAGALAGRPAAATELEERLRTRLGSLRASCASTTRPETLIVVGRQPASLQGIYAAGPRTYLGQLLEVCGGRNVTPDGPHAYVPLGKEQIVAMDPELIVDTSLGEAGSDPAVVNAHKRIWKQLASVRAVRDGRVHCLSDPHLTVPGPAIVDAAAQLAAIVQGASRR